jgi:hypothetical protein
VKEEVEEHRVEFEQVEWSRGGLILGMLFSNSLLDGGQCESGVGRKTGFGFEQFVGSFGGGRRFSSWWCVQFYNRWVVRSREKGLVKNGDELER